MSTISQPVNMCRICQEVSLETILDFGEIYLTGVFLENGGDVDKASMSLAQCTRCGLVQLEHEYSQHALYGKSYGYESHLNQSMVDHLKRKARLLEARFLNHLNFPVIVDIASNDGTLLSGFQKEDSKLIGIDPLLNIVSDYYPKKSIKIESFFSKESYFDKFTEKANLVTSLSVLYDLPDPKRFVSDIYEILDEGGVWHFEQSYLPTMVETLSYDTICHEHLLYLSMHDILNLTESAGFQIESASLNSVNGGSIAVTAIKSKESISRDPFVDFLLQKEIDQGYQDLSAMKKFAIAANGHRESLKNLIMKYAKSDTEIFALGASTKGNVLLQWAELSHELISSVGDVNPRKFGKETPGTKIPIESENWLLEKFGSGSIAIVLPWHFRDGIVRNCEKYLSNGGRLLFPLPNIQIVSG